MIKPIDYEKYLNMDIKQLVNSLEKEEKNEEKIYQKLFQSQELIEFLKYEIKEKLNDEEYLSIPLNIPKIKDIEIESEYFAIKDFFKKLLEDYDKKFKDNDLVKLHIKYLTIRKFEKAMFKG